MNSSALKALMVIVSVFFLAIGGLASAAPITIHGHVTSHVTGGALGGVDIQAYVGNASGDATSAPDGTYVVTLDTDPSPGSVGHVHVWVSGYASLDADFDPFDADIDMDFSMRIYGTVSGTVHHSISGDALDQVPVSALRFDGVNWQPAAVTATLDGAYVLSNVEPGTYRICAGGLGSGFARRCFDGFDVHTAMDLQAATPVDVADGVAVAGIDLQIVEGAHLQGTIRDAQTGIAVANQQLSMEIYDAAGKLLEAASAYTDESGSYVLNGLASGTFHVAAGIPWGQLRGKQLYAGIACPTETCPPATTGDAITVPATGTVAGIDFMFSPAATLAGSVVDQSNGMPVVGVQIEACLRPIVVWPTCYVTDAGPDGRYEIGLEVGEYTLFAAAPDSHVDTIYPDTPCWSYFCVRNSNPSIPVQEGDTLTGYDFALHRSAWIEGTVTDDATGAAAAAQIAMFDANHRYIWGFGSDAQGHYTSVKWRAGTYYLAAYYDWPDRCALYENSQCPANASDAAAIAAANPTPIVVAEGSTVSGIDLHVPIGDHVFADGFDSL